MLPNPFYNVPKVRVIQRSSVLSLPLMLVGVLFVGFLSVSESLILNERMMGRNDFEDLSKRSQVGRAFVFYYRWLGDAWSPPEGCSISTPSPSEFRRAQCQEFWNNWGRRTVVASIPLMFWFLVSAVCFLMAMALYRRGQREGDRALKKPAGREAFVATRPELPGDFRSWLMGLKRIAVGKATATAVYVPETMTTPLPGEKVVVFPVGDSPRGVIQGACLYAPHMVVMKVSSN